MKTKLLSVIFVAGVFVLLTFLLVLPAQGQGRPLLASQITSDVYQAGRLFIESSDDVTFTEFVFLPLVLRNWHGCPTVQPLSPTNGSQLSTIAPLFRWYSEDKPGIDALQLEISSTPGFTSVIRTMRYENPSGIEEFRFPSNFAPNTIYYWRIQSLCGNTGGSYSAVFSFTTGSGGNILPAPTQISPSNEASVPWVVTLEWSSVAGAKEYVVFWQLEGSNNYSFEWTEETEITLGLRKNAWYRWWVAARNDYAIGSESETRRFVTNATSSSLRLLLSSPNMNYAVVKKQGETEIVLLGRKQH